MIQLMKRTYSSHRYVCCYAFAATLAAAFAAPAATTAATAAAHASVADAALARDTAGLTSVEVVGVWKQ